MAQWIEHQPANQRIARSTPSQGTCLGDGPGALLGLCERQPIDVPLMHVGVSLPLFPLEGGGKGSGRVCLCGQICILTCFHCFGLNGAGKVGQKPLGSF